MSAAGKSLKARILEADDLRFEDVEIPEWGGVKVRIRALSGQQLDAYEAARVELKNGGQDVDLSMVNFRAELVVKCLFDPETDERIFRDSDVGMLGKKSAGVLDDLFDVCNALTKRKPAEVQANLGEAPSDGSSSD